VCVTLLLGMAAAGCVEQDGATDDGPFETIELHACPGLIITQTDGGAAVSEGGNTDSYQIRLCEDPPSSITVDISVDGGQATVSPTQLTFNADWDTDKTVTITAVDDFVDEDTITATVRNAVSGNAGWSALPDETFEVTITDDDTAGLSIVESGGSTSIIEGGAGDNYTVVLTSQPTSSVTVTLTPDSQSTVSPNPLTFTTGNWNVAQTVTVTAVNDSVAEGNHTSSISHLATSTDGKYNNLAGGTVVASITDNDTASVTISQSSNSTVVNEGGAGDSYTVVLTSQPTVNVTVTPSFTAAQITVTPSPLTFTSGNWNTAQTLTVGAVDDPDIETEPHTTSIAHVVSSGDGNYNNFALSNVTVTIHDNDTAGVIITQSSGSTAVNESGGTDSYTIQLATRPSSTVTVSISTDSQITASVPSVAFDAGTWNVAQTVTVTAVNDSIDEANTHTGVILHSVGSGDQNYDGLATSFVNVSVTDNDTASVTLTEVGGGTTHVTEGGNTDTIQFVLGSQPVADVTIDLAVNTEVDVSPTSVTFTAGNWNSPKTVTVSAVNDDVAEASPHTGTITTTASSTDPKYNNIAVADVNVLVTDNDLASIVITPASGQTTEAGGTATFSVRLATRPNQDVTVSLASSDTGEGTVSPSTMTFRKNTNPLWNMNQTLTVTGIDDEMIDGNVAYTVSATSASADSFYSGKTTNISLTNQDNDAAGVLVSPTNGLTTTEGGGTAMFNIRLTSQPSANVRVDLSTSDNTEGTISPAQATLTGANWSTGVNVTVTGVDDMVDDGDVGYTIVAANTSSTDANFNNLDVQDVSVSNTDNDTPAFTIADVTLSEQDSNVQMNFTVTLSIPSTSTLTVNWATSAHNVTRAEEGLDYTSASGTLTFNPMDTSEGIVVTILGDNLTEGTEIFRVNLSNNSAGTTISDNRGLGNITDDDATPVANNSSVSTDEDMVFNGTLSASDADSDPLNFVIATGASKGTALVTNARSGSFRYTPNPNENGSDTFTFRVDDGTNTSSVATVAVTINPINDPPTIDAGGPYTVNEGREVSLTATGADIDPDTLSYTWDFDGDGQYDDASGRVVNYFAADGPATVTVRAQVNDGTVTRNDTATVTVSNVTPTLEAGANGNTYTGVEGDPIPFAVVGTDPGDDTLTYTWSFGDTGTATGAGLNATSHTYAEQERYTVTVTVRDDDGATANVNLTAVISNAAPAFRNNRPLAVVREGEEYVYDADMVERGTMDVLTWQLIAGPEGMAIDPTTTCGAAPGNNPARCRKLRWTPTVAQLQQTAPFSVVLRVTDDDGGSAQLSWNIEANPADTDNGGASDNCELAHNLNINDPADDAADPDGDGILTRDECRAGTDPTVPNTPNAPAPFSPVSDALINSANVTLIVDNATDPDGDPLTYLFEVVDRATNDVVYVTPDNALVVSGAFRTQTVIVENPDNLMVFQEDGRYLWHARAWDGSGFGPVSSDGSFIFSLDDGVPSAPVAVSPIGTAASMTPALTVNNATDPEGEALTYEFEVLDNGTFDPVVSAVGVAQGNGATTAWTVDAALEENVVYRWHARATDGRNDVTDTGPWSDWVTFRVDSTESFPDVPVILYPEPGANTLISRQSDIVIVATGVMRDADNDAVTYTFRIADNAAMNNPAMVEGLAVNARLQVAATADMFTGFSPVDNTMYYVEVFGTDGAGNGESATTRFRFSVGNEAPGAVMIVAPTDGAVIASVVPGLQWRNAADPEGDLVSYDIEVYRDEALTDLEFAVTGVEPNGDAMTDLTSPTLAASTRYWWRVRGVDTAGAEGPWATAAFFVSLADLAPPAPQLVAPALGEQLEADAPVVVAWENVVDPELAPVTYRVEVFDAAGERVDLHDGVVEDASGTTSVELNATAPGGYSWRVNASDGGQSGPWSERWTFGVAVPVPDPPSDGGNTNNEVDPPRYPAPIGEGCGCSVPTHTPFAWPAVLVLLAVGAVAWRRRG